MSELLRVWGIEVVFGLTILLPLAVIFHGIATLREEKRERRRRGAGR